MKKMFLYLVKFVNHFTNDKLTPAQEAQSIFEILVCKSDVNHTLDVNEELQKLIRKEMMCIKSKYAAIIFKIDEIYHSDSEKIIHKLEDTKDERFYN